MAKIIFINERQNQRWFLVTDELYSKLYYYNTLKGFPVLDADKCINQNLEFEYLLDEVYNSDEIPQPRGDLEIRVV